MKRCTIAVLLLALCAGMAAARNLYVLCGFRIGQHISIVTRELGTPYKVVPFADGFKSHVFVGKKHYVVFQTNPLRPDRIWSIQVTGLSNQAHCGLAGVNLGDGKDRILAAFGRPDDVRHAVDEITKKTLGTIVYYSYTQSRNCSFEVKDNRVSSIKVQDAAPAFGPDAVVTVKNLIEAANSRNYYWLCSVMSAEFRIIVGDKEYRLETSPLAALQKTPCMRGFSLTHCRDCPRCGARRGRRLPST